MALTDRPEARTSIRDFPRPGQPGRRLSPRESLRTAVTTRKLQALEADWLFQSVSAEGRTRLLVEHGLMPKAALGAR